MLSQTVPKRKWKIRLSEPGAGATGSWAYFKIKMRALLVL